MIKKIVVVAAMAAGLVMMSTGCTSVSTEPDEVALHYKGGSTSSSKFANCVPVSDRNFDGPGDKHYVYPDGQRTFSFTGAAGSEQAPINVTTKDSQTLAVPGFVTFKLVTDCDTLRKFHETIGKKYLAYKDGKDKNAGWNEFLNDYLAVPLTKAMNQAALNTNWEELYSQEAKQSAFEKAVVDSLPASVQKALGGDYLKILEVSISKPTPDKGLLDQLAQKEQNRLANIAQAEKNKTQATKYDGFKQCRERGISEQTCLIMNLAEGGKVTLWPIPTGQGVVVNPPTK
jgi:hypothetical protein